MSLRNLWVRAIAGGLVWCCVQSASASTLETWTVTGGQAVIETGTTRTVVRLDRSTLEFISLDGVFRAFTSGSAVFRDAAVPKITYTLSATPQTALQFATPQGEYALSGWDGMVDGAGHVLLIDDAQLTRIVGSGGSAWTETVGRVNMRMETALSHAEEQSTRPIPPSSGSGGGDPAEICAGAVSGPDVIVGSLPDVSNYGQVGGVYAYAVGTTSCNLGDTNLSWVSNTNQHPVIGGYLYRLKNGRLEQIGQSWLKHGFAALTGNVCCTCTNPGTGSQLGPGCSDPYSSGLNGSQSGLGPKWQINAATGAYPYPPANPAYSGAIARRIQVAGTDVDPAQNAGALYFIEGHYIAPDDTAAGHDNNNASYRQCTVAAGTFNLTLAGTTQQQKAAILAWKDQDPTVTTTNIDIPSDGRMTLAYKVTDLGGGSWHYEFALYNMNSDRSAQSFSVPVAAGTTVTNIGFHDVFYHDNDGMSGVTYDGTDWPGTYAGGAVTWATSTFATNPNANALRYGTTYNFRFDANAAPGVSMGTIGLFKSGAPASVTSAIMAPGGVAANDTCANATLIGNGSFMGATTTATHDSTASCDGAGASRDVWFAYSPIATGTATASTCASAIDTALAVFASCGGAELTCNDNCGGSPCGGTASCVSFGVTCGSTYLIRVGDKGTPGSFTLTTSSAAAVPGNDACASAGTSPIPGSPTSGITSTVNGSYAASTADNAAVSAATCDSGLGQRDVYHSFTPNLSGPYLLSLCGSSVVSDTVLSVHTGCPTTDANQVGGAAGCDDDGCGTSAGLSLLAGVNLTAGTPYLVRIGGWDSTIGGACYQLVTTYPDNNLCGNAVALTGTSGAVSGSTVGSTNDGSATCGAAGAADVWYTYTTPASTGCGGGTTLVLNTCGAGTDTILSVYSGTCGALTQVSGACNDNCAGSPCGGPGSCLTVTTAANTQYRIRVASSGATGTFTLTYMFTGAVPTNDTCATATVVSGSSVSTTWSSCGANLDGPTVSACDTATAINSDVWFRWTAPCSGSVAVNTCGPTSIGGLAAVSDTVLAIYSNVACPPALGNQLACDDDSSGCAQGGSLRSQLTFTATGNSQYIIRVGSFGAEQGSGTLNITQAADTTPPVISVCASGQTLTANANCQATVPSMTGSITASDNCTPAGSLTITQSPTNGTVITTGNTVVTFTVRDANNNSATCSATLTVNDTTPPTIATCASGQVLSANASCQASVPNLASSVVASDNCTAAGSLTKTQVPAVGALIGLGNTVVTITVRDAANNSATCTATLTVNDTTPPTITTCASGQMLAAGLSCQSMAPDLTGLIAASDNCTASGSLVKSQAPAAGALIGLGYTVVTITVRDAANNSATCTATVTVTDQTPPVISTCAGDQTVAGSGDPCQAAAPSFTGAPLAATDNCPGEVTFAQSPTVGTLVGGGDTVVTLTASDGAGNTASCTATLHVTSCGTAVTIVSASPPNGHRDTLQNTDPGLVPQGIGVPGTPDEGSVTNYGQPTVTFSGVPSPSPSPGNIGLSCTGGPCPTVTAVSGSGAGPYTLTLSGTIPVLHCTTLTFAGTGAGVKLQWQFLPGDENLNGIVTGQDVLAQVNAINGGTANGNLALYDTNRNGSVTGQDVLRLVQLINGTSATQAFNGAGVAACP